MPNVNTGLSGAAAGAAIGGPVGAAVGGIGGYMLGADDKSNDYLSDALKAAQNIPLPVLKEYYPELYQQVVELNPELADAVQMGPSAMEGVKVDQGSRQAQLAALRSMQEVADQGGMNLTDKANLAKIQNEVNTNLQGQEGAIQQNMAAKGLSGGMSELVARNMAAQAAANRQSQAGLDVAAQAQARALQAMMQQGQMAGNMQAQDFGQQAQKAQAADAIARFNAQNLQDTRNMNVGTKNNAQQWNAQNAQSIAGQNTGLKNQAQQYNLGLNQQQFNNQMTKVGLGNDALAASAVNAQKQAENQNQFVGGLISAAGQYYGGKK